jgi:outer membrane receptor protein involved in Fe transport
MIELRRLGVTLGLGLVLLTPALLSATPDHDPGSLTGQITDRDRHPVAGVAVSIRALQRSTTSDGQGRYRLADLPNGRYRVSFAQVGFAPRLAEVTIAAATDLSVQLTPTAVALPPIVVSAAPTPRTSLTSPLSATVLEGDALRRSQSVSIARAIELLPGGRSLTTGAQIAKPMIRGLSGDRVLVTENGHRLSDYSWSDEDGPSLDARLAERVEVIRGPMSLLYGSEALAGVVNAIPAALPEAGAATRWHAELSGASNNAETGTMVGLSGSKGRSGYRLTGLLRRAAALHTPEGELENTGFVAVNGEGAYAIRNDHGSVTFRVAHNGGEFKLLEANGPVQVPGVKDAGPERKSHDERLQVDAVRVAGGWRLNGQAQFQQHGLIEVSDDASGTPGTEATAFDLRLNTISATASAHHDVGGPVALTVGATGIHQSSATRGPIPLVPNATTNGVAGFAVAEVHQRRWNLLVGARGDASKVEGDPNATLAFTGTSKSFSALTGNVGASYTLTDGVALGINGGRAWRAPNLFELFTNGPKVSEARYEIGDADLRAEVGTTLDGSLRWQAAHVRGEVTAFRHLVKDFIYIAPTGTTNGGLAVYQYRQADALLTGAEAEAEVDLAEAFTARARIDGVHATNRETDAPLPLIPPTRSVIGLEWHNAAAHHAHLGVDLVSVAKQDRLAALDLATDSYHLVEIEGGVRQVVGGRLIEIDLAVHNAGNVAYKDFLSRYKQFALNPGRDIMLRISTDF